MFFRYEFEILWSFIRLLPQTGDVSWNLNTSEMSGLPWTFSIQTESSRDLVKSSGNSCLEFSAIVEK